MKLHPIGSHGEHYASVHHWVAEARWYALIYSTWEAEVSLELRATLPVKLQDHSAWEAVDLHTWKAEVVTTIQCS